MASTDPVERAARAHVLDDYVDEVVETIREPGYDPERRYRIVVVNRNDGIEELASAPDGAGVGVALITLHDELREADGRSLYELGRIGVRDSLEHKWIILPWTRRS